MRNITGRKVRLGIFVFVCLALFIAGLYFIGGKQKLFSSTFQISGIFKDINGLQVGNNVRFSGINIGIIEDIQQITDTTVRVDMIIDEETRKFIKRNAMAIIGTDGLMGNKIVIIIPGTSGKPQIEDQDFIATSQPVNIDDILVKLKVTADNAAAITDDLASVMENLHAGKGTIGKLFMDTTFADDVAEALINIKLGAGGFKQNMDAASHNILLRGYLKKSKNKKTK